MPEHDALLAGLNDAQRQAVATTEGPVLVLAGAGSGKTRVITRRAAYLVGAGKAEPGHILAVTFTNKAAEEMRQRVARLIGKDKAKRVVISTFHSFCLRVLRSYIERLGYRRDFTISTEGDMRALIRRVIDDLDGAKESFSPDLFLGAIGAMKNAGAGPGEPPPWRAPQTKAEAESARKADERGTRQKYEQWLTEAYTRYESALRAANSLDFDDLLLMTLRLWRDHPAILEKFRERFRYVMVDEFQDTNAVQYRIVKLLVEEHRRLCVVGDDDQSIYSWRGADIRNILGFERDFPDATIIKLEQNYRSTGSILEAANAVIANNRDRRDKRLWSDKGKGRLLDWIVTGDDEHEAKTAVAWLESIRAKTKSRYSDFAVLYRSNTQSRPLEIAFQAAGIPYVVIGGQAFYERAEVRDVVSYLKALSNPRDETALLRIINVPRRGIGDTTLHRVHEVCRRRRIPFIQALGEAVREGLVTGEPRESIGRFLGLMQTFRGKLSEGGALSNLFREMLEAVSYRYELERTAKSPEQAFNRWENVQAVARAIEEYEGQTARPTLRGFLDQSSLATDADGRGKQEQRRQGVTLMTIHAAKGLEFPFVFVMGLEEGLLPHAKSAAEGHLEEERRLCYVALTRGMRHVTLFEALSRSRRGNDVLTETSRFMKEIPEPLLAKRVYAAADLVRAKVEPDADQRVRKRTPKKKPRGAAQPS